MCLHVRLELLFSVLSSSPASQLKTWFRFTAWQTLVPLAWVSPVWLDLAPPLSSRSWVEPVSQHQNPRNQTHSPWLRVSAWVWQLDRDRAFTSQLIISFWCPNVRLKAPDRRLFRSHLEPCLDLVLIVILCNPTTKELYSIQNALPWILLMLNANDVSVDLHIFYLVAEVRVGSDRIWPTDSLPRLTWDQIAQD